MIEDFILSILIWVVLGGLCGFYVALARQHDPKVLAAAGAVVAVVIGEVGVRLGIIASFGSAVITILALAVIAALLLPYGTFDRRVSMRARVAYLAYALSIPTVLLVFSIVIFPVIWNLIFSLRDISTGDLADAQILDFSNLTADNFEAQLGLRIDPIPCETVEGSDACAIDEDGQVIYPDARDYIGRDDYGRYREVNDIDLFGTHYAIGVRDREFYPMIWRTLFYTLSSTILAILFGLVAALIVRDKFPGRSIFRGFILFPYIAPVISVAFIWQVLLQQNGLVNETLDTNTAFLSTREEILGIPVPLIMVILFQTWRYFPFAFLFLLARLQAIPDDMYEAAKVDGATPSQRLWFITLPQLQAVFGTLFLLRFIWTFNKFDDVYLLTGPITQTKVIPVRIFEALFIEGNIGQASAVAVIMGIMLAVILFIYFRYFLADEAH